MYLRIATFTYKNKESQEDIQKNVAFNGKQVRIIENSFDLEQVTNSNILKEIFFLYLIMTVPIRNSFSDLT